MKYRPGFPPALIEFLVNQCGLTSDCVVADVGSGTGLLTEVFLRNNNVVFGIEPNRKMREAACRNLARYPQFRSVDATAEGTTLQDHSVDFVTVGRALHWFDYDRAFSEFLRIMKPGAWAVMVWMKRRNSPPFAFAYAYESLLLTYSVDHQEKRQSQSKVESRLTADGFQRRALEDQWTFDLQGLMGLTLSYSVTPEPDDARFLSMKEALQALFHKHEHNGKVVLGYETLIYYARREVLTAK
ncbi:MAG: class I SAM-dependent methyltransferase [Acidobacteriota bacterium]